MSIVVEITDNKGDCELQLKFGLKNEVYIRGRKFKLQVKVFLVVVIHRDIFHDTESPARLLFIQ